MINSICQPKSILKLFFLISFSFIINSCKKDSKYYTQVSFNSEIEQAKNWYESLYPSTAVSNTKLISNATGNSINFSKRIKPDWGKSSSYSRLGKKVIEMPIPTDNNFGAEYKNTKTGEVYSGKKYNRTYFLLLNNGKNYQAFIMMIMADPAYVNNDFSKLSHNTYRKHDADFSGLVLYFTPDGRYVGGYKYVNGQLITSSSVTQTQSVQSSKTTNGIKTLSDCTDYYLITYYDDGSQDAQYLGTYCPPCSEQDVNVNGCSTGGSNPGGASGPPPPPANCGGGTSPSPGSPYNQSIHTTINVVTGGGDGGMPAPSDPCNPTNSAGTFGLDNSNAIVPDDNFDALLNYASTVKGYTVKDPFNAVLTVNGVDYLGQITEMKLGNKILAYFSPDVNSGLFLVGMEYNIGEGTDTDTGTTTNPGPSNDPEFEAYITLPGGPVTYSNAGGGNLGNLPISAADGQYTYGEPIDPYDSNASYYNTNSAHSILVNLKDQATGDPIELYLIATYQGNSLLDLSKYSIGGIKNYRVGSYYLTPNYDATGLLLFYTAWRNTTNGIEYLVQPSVMANFIKNYSYYLAAANLVYLNGRPSAAMIKLMAGDYVSGLANMWGQALTNPTYLTNLAVAFVLGAVPADEVTFIDYDDITVTSKSIPNFQIGMTIDDFETNLSKNTGVSWQEQSGTSGNIKNLYKGDFQYTSRRPPYTNSGNSVDVIYKGVLQVKYRLQ